VQKPRNKQRYHRYGYANLASRLQQGVISLWNHCYIWANFW